MWHRILLFSALGGCAQIPADGPLPSGLWGGTPRPVSLTVRADGTASLDLACTGGESVGTVDIVDGAVSGTFRFDGEAEPYEVLLDGIVAGNDLEAVLTSDDSRFGDPQDFLVVRGAERGFEVTCAEPFM